MIEGRHDNTEPATDSGPPPSWLAPGRAKQGRNGIVSLPSVQTQVFATGSR